jgi:hypothetical protein
MLFTESVIVSSAVTERSSKLRFVPCSRNDAVILNHTFVTITVNS